MGLIPVTAPDHILSEYLGISMSLICTVIRASVVDEARFREAAVLVVERHPVLRTPFDLSSRAGR